MSVKERLKSYLKLKNITIQRFEMMCGLSNGYVSNMRKGIGEDKLEQISKIFPDMNMSWLVLGEGEMLKGAFSVAIDDGEPVISGKLIPFYDAEAAAGIYYGMNIEATRPIGMLEIGGLLKDSESALRVYGNSMVPNYPAGCVVGLRPHMDSFIEPGSVYVIETFDNRYIKRLYYNKGKTAFRCVSDNHMTHDGGAMAGEFYYPDFEIPFSEVRQLFRVIGVIKRNQL